MAGRAPRSFVRLLVTVVLAGVLGVGILAVTGGATAAQQPTLRQQLVGTWTLVSSVNNNVESFGPNPLGIAMFDSAGHFAVMLMRRDLPKFASNNRNTGTPEENKAVVQGSIAQFGTYSVSEAERVLTYHFEASTFPNRTGTDQKRVNLKVTADEWTYDDPTSSIGGTSHSVWKRAK